MPGMSSQLRATGGSMIDITQVPIGTIVHGRDIEKMYNPSTRYVSHACMDCQKPRWVPVHTTASTMHNSPQRCSLCNKTARRARVTRGK